jgi:transportin-1
MAWQPEDEPLRQLVQCLKDSLAGQNPSVQKNAEIVSRFYLLAE